MKSFKVFTMVIITIVLVGLAQSQAKVTVRLHIPPEGQWQIENLWRVDLNNQTQKTYTCYLHGDLLEATKGLVFKANSREFQLPPGKQTRRGRADVDPLRDVWYAPDYKEFALRTGGLPEGRYTFIVLLEPNLGGDTVEFDVRVPGVLRLLPVTGGRHPRFAWVRPTSLPPGTVSYNLTIVPLLQGQSPEEAMKANKPLYTKTGITTEFFDYPAGSPPLPESGNFCYLVTLNVNNQPLITSEVGGFSRLGGAVPAKPECKKWECTVDPSHKWECTDPLCPHCPPTGVECKSWQCPEHGHRWECTDDRCPRCKPTGEPACKKWKCPEPECGREWECNSSQCPNKECGCATRQCPNGHQWSCTDKNCPVCGAAGTICRNWQCKNCGANWVCSDNRCPRCHPKGKEFCTNWTCPNCGNKWRCASSKCPKCGCANWTCSKCGNKWKCKDNRCPKCHPRGRERQKITCHNCGQIFDGIDDFSKHQCPKERK